jgi:hypothetical protein
MVPLGSTVKQLSCEILSTIGIVEVRVAEQKLFKTAR